MSSRSSWGIACCLATLLAGCSSLNTRIREHADTFASLDAETQQRVRKGIIMPGDAVEIAYIAAGKPDSIEKVERPDGGYYEIWTYTTLVQQQADNGGMEVPLQSPFHQRYDARLNNRTSRYNAKQPHFQLLVYEGYIISVHVNAPQEPERSSDTPSGI
jgi:hypothetical protein